MTAAAPVDEDLAARRARNAEKARAWRKAHPGADRTWRERQARQRATQPRRAVDDVGEPIAEGRPFTDDFGWCDAEWTRLLAGARFADVAAPRF